MTDRSVTHINYR